MEYWSLGPSVAAARRSLAMIEVDSCKVGLEVIGRHISSVHMTVGSSSRRFQDAGTLIRASGQNVGHTLQNRVIEPIGAGVVDGLGTRRG